jgi:hypothetical protein
MKMGDWICLAVVEWTGEDLEELKKEIRRKLKNLKQGSLIDIFEFTI